MRFFNLHVNEDQLKIIQDSLETHARLGIGQLEVILSNLGFRTYEQFKDVVHDLDSAESKQAIKVLKDRLFKMSAGGSLSLRSERVHDNFRVAYDLFLTIQGKLTEEVGKLVNAPYKLSTNGVIDIEEVLGKKEE